VQTLWLTSESTFMPATAHCCLCALSPHAALPQHFSSLMLANRKNTRPFPRPPLPSHAPSSRPLSPKHTAFRHPGSFGTFPHTRTRHAPPHPHAGKCSAPRPFRAQRRCCTAVARRWCTRCGAGRQ